MADKERRDPPGKIGPIELNQKWPKGSYNGRPGRWEQLQDAFDTLKPDGPPMSVVLDHKSDANRAASAINGYAKRQNCDKQGWSARTRITEENGVVKLYAGKVRV